MSDSPSSSSDQQFITQQPLPQETEDPKRSTENAGDSCSCPCVGTECAACCGECCMETGQTSHECSTACCIGVFACNECGCWEQCCNCCCHICSETATGCN